MAKKKLNKKTSKKKVVQKVEPYYEEQRIPPMEVPAYLNTNVIPWYKRGIVLANIVAVLFLIGVLIVIIL